MSEMNGPNQVVIERVAKYIREREKMRGNSNQIHILNAGGPNEAFLNTNDLRIVLALAKMADRS